MAETAWACKADIYSKTYPEGVGGGRSWRNLWRAQVPIACEYTCTKGDQTVKVKGTHKVSYWSDSDSTLSCIGVDYRTQWVNAGPGYAREVAMPHPRVFVGDDAAAPELRALAAKHK